MSAVTMERDRPVGHSAIDEARWAAVVRRDSAADGRFYSAVQTTGIYCRPSCPARLPRRENVRFYDSRSEAERAGFRPCKRCRPNDASTVEVGAADATTIRFAVGACSLGPILVAAGGKGICAILFGEDSARLKQDLQGRFPNADLIGGGGEIERRLAEVVAFIEAPHRGLDLPLELRGTAFQQRVWQALRQIPAGRTASYAQLAGMVGAPKAVRAVAQACAANPLAVAVPCHRVVRNDGALSGYRWGVERKRALLDREARP